MSAARKRILCLFDVDGTLTKPRREITEEFLQFILQKVKPIAALGLVSGSDYKKMAEQMRGEEVLSQFDYVFSENGLVYYQKGEVKNKESILNHIGEQKVQKLINFALGYMSKIELPAKRGNFVEFRSGMINLSPIGRSCSYAEREDFAKHDAEHKVRENFVKALKDEFGDSELNFALGGQISIDVFPTGWDKRYCLRHVSDNHSEIHFFGDRTALGGNDHELYCDERTVGHAVSSPEDTKAQIIKCFNL